MKNLLVNITLSLLFLSVSFSEVRPLSMKAFDDESLSNTYNRGTYMIIVPESLSAYLTNELYGGDFVTKKHKVLMLN